MPALLAKWFSQFLLLFAALATGQWALFNLLNLVKCGQVVIGNHHWEQQYATLVFRLVLSAFALASIVLTDIYEFYIPRKDLRKVRREYLNDQREIWHQHEVFKKAKGLRVGVLYARRRWYWPFWKVFRWIWSDGFLPPAHRDVNLHFACWQGVSGKAFRTELPTSFYFNAQMPPWSFKEKWLFCNPFRFSIFQLQTTANMRGILCIPLWKKGHGDSPSYRVIGTITLDAFTVEEAGIIEKNEQVLIDYFSQIGKVLATLNL